MRPFTMRYAIVAILTLWACGCVSQDRDRQTRDSAAREAGRLAHKIAKESEKAAREADRKLRQAAREAHEGWKDAAREDRAKGRN